LKELSFVSKTEVEEEEGGGGGGLSIKLAISSSES